MQFLDTVKEKISSLTNVNVNNNNNKTTVTCTQVKQTCSFLSIDFPSKINDRWVGSIQLFPMIDYKILANSHH